MIFYHGTTKEAWEEIQAEGVLWGKPRSWIKEEKEPNDYRYTYLSPHIEHAASFGHLKGSGAVLLEVEYEPVGVDGRGIDNHAMLPNRKIGPKPWDFETCWQFSVFVPIPLSRVKRIDEFIGPFNASLSLTLRLWQKLFTDGHWMPGYDVE